MKKVVTFTYCFTLIFLVIFSYAFVDVNLFYLHALFTNFAFSQRAMATILYVFFISVLFLHFFWIQKLFLQKKLTRKNIVILILATCCIVLFSYPAMLSYDIFNYIATAKVAFFYKENPYIIMPIDIPNEPVLRFLHAGNKIALYGPIWILLTILPHLAGGGHFILTLFLFKFLSIIGYVGVCFLLWKLSGDIKILISFAFNPLVILEIVVSGHNDAVMIALALTSFYFLMKKRIVPALLAFLFSVGIKYATLFLIPLFIFVCIAVRNKKIIHWEKVFFFSTILLFMIFLLSPLREEVYPWYALWFYPFLLLGSRQKSLLLLCNALFFGLLLRYVPFMLSGTYFGLTPFLKVLFTVMPVVGVLIFLLIQRLKQTTLYA